MNMLFNHIFDSFLLILKDFSLFTMKMWFPDYYIFFIDTFLLFFSLTKVYSIYDI